MSSFTESIIAKSIERIKTTYFRIVKNDVSYDVIQYFGPVKTPTEMMRDGWNVHPYLSSYLSDIYPIFSVNDFVSDDGITLRKKTPDELLKEKLSEFIEYFKMDRNLLQVMKEFKDFIAFIGISFKEFKTFDKLCETTIDTIWKTNVSNIDKVTNLSKFIDIKTKVYEELETVGIEKPYKFINENFSYLLLIIE